MTENLLILQSTARSGTTWLKTLLGSSPDAKLYGEFLHPSEFPWGFYSFYISKLQEDPTAAFPLKQKQVALDYFQWIAGQTPSQTVVLDLKLEQLAELPAVATGMYQTRAKFIVLQRLNLLKQTVSAKLMAERQKTGDTVVHRDYVPEQIRITVKPAEILHWMRLRHALHQTYLEKLQKSSRPYFLCTYEELVGPLGASKLAALAAFAGFDGSGLKTNLVKQNPLPLWELVSNYAELEHEVKNSEFESTLYLPS